jgi:hypothetical protein
MTKRIFLLLYTIFLVLNCGGNKRSDSDDRAGNGGFVRFTLEGKNMHDDFFVGQFTPAGDLFKTDNLQLFNFNQGSAKYPQLLLNLNFQQRDLKKWQSQTLTTDVLAFSVSPSSPPLQSKGSVKIMQVSDKFIEGVFSGELVHPQSGKTYSLHGEFKAVIKMNI